MFIFQGKEKNKKWPTERNRERKEQRIKSGVTKVLFKMVARTCCAHVEENRTNKFQFSHSCRCKRMLSTDQIILFKSIHALHIVNYYMCYGLHCIRILKFFSSYFFVSLRKEAPHPSNLMAIRTFLRLSYAIQASDKNGNL